MNRSLDYYIKHFLLEYLPSYTSISDNTLKSYRDTFKLYINYMVYKKEKITLETFTYENITKFIKWLEESRNSSERSCNQRLACLKSFCKLLILKEPNMLYECQKILEIKFKKYQEKERQYLTIDEVKAIINSPSNDKEKMILSTLYYTGARINELININTSDINFDNKFLKIIGKGNKIRIVPLIDEYMNLLKNYISKNNISNNEILLKSNQKDKYTSNGIRYIISKYTKNISFKVTPHTFRHSIASHLLEADTSIIYIRDFLGHEHISTTEIYAKVNLSLKKKALESNMPNLEVNEKPKWQSDNNLLDWLNNL